MRFSVVTISFNQARWLPSAIRSVLDQAAPGIEIEYIVCDPGSTDGSRAIIESHGEQIAHRLFEKDHGPADGLNRGFARATGDIFCYLNSDDMLLPGALARVADHFRRNPGIDVVIGHGHAVDAEGRVLRRIWSEPYSPRAVACGAHVQIQPSTFFRAEAFRKAGGFNPRDRIAWDGDLLMRFHLSGARIAVLDEYLSCFRLHAESITNSGSGEDLRRRQLDDQFAQLMGRPRNAFDPWVARGLRLAKHLRWPSRAFERLFRGPLYRRGEWRFPLPIQRWAAPE